MILRFLRGLAAQYRAELAMLSMRRYDSAPGVH